MKEVAIIAVALEKVIGEMRGPENTKRTKALLEKLGVRR